MNDNKTRATAADPRTFIESVEHPTRRADALVLLELMTEITGEPPALWGESIIGFGQYHYRYASGREGDWFKVGFSPRKQHMSLYIMRGISAYPEHLQKLGKHKIGKACLYVNKLADIDLDILRDLVRVSFDQMQQR